MATTKQMYAFAKTAAGAAKVEALYAEAEVWAGKQPQGMRSAFPHT